MKISAKSILALSTLLLLSGPVKADSYYSTFGLGMPHYYVSPQSVGMGGAGMAVQQYLSLNEMNPAGLDLKGFTMISASFQGEMINSTVSGQTAQTRQGRATGFRFVIPLKKNRIAFIAGLRPLAKSEMTVEFDQNYDDLTVQRHIGTSGGLSAGSIGLKYSISSRLHVGALFDFNFGAYNEKWSTDFDDDTYIDTNDDISSHLWGTGAELGVIYKPLPVFSLAGVLRTRSDLHIETTITPGSGIKQPAIVQSALYPLAFGIGAALDLPTLLVAADFYQQNWQDYHLDSRQAGNLANYTRISAGVEYVGSKDYLVGYTKRIAFRIGGSWAQLPFNDAFGNGVKELLGTAGFGFPFNKNLGRIDVSLEAGKRFSSDSASYSEDLFRITASVTSAEKWFRRIF